MYNNLLVKWNQGGFCHWQTRTFWGLSSFNEPHPSHSQSCHKFLCHDFFFTQSNCSFGKQRHSFLLGKEDFAFSLVFLWVKNAQMDHKALFPHIFNSYSELKHSVHFQILLCWKGSDTTRDLQTHIYLHFVGIFSLYLGINFLSFTDLHVLQFNLKNVISSDNPRMECYHN